MIPLAAAFTAGFCIAAGYAIYKIRKLRGVIRYNVDHTFKQATRRYQAWLLMCDECKQLAAPWWKP